MTQNVKYKKKHNEERIKQEFAVDDKLNSSLERKTVCIL